MVFINWISRCRQNLDYYNFTSSIGKPCQETAPKSVPHVQHASVLIQPIKSWFVALSLLFSSPFLELPTNSLRIAPAGTGNHDIPHSRRAQETELGPMTILKPMKVLAVVIFFYDFQKHVYVNDSLTFHLFWQGKFQSLPTVLVSAEHERRSLLHDASSVWLEDITTTSFKICARELQNFDGAHQNVHIVSIFPLVTSSFFASSNLSWKCRPMLFLNFDITCSEKCKQRPLIYSSLLCKKYH